MASFSFVWLLQVPGTIRFLHEESLHSLLVVHSTLMHLPVNDHPISRPVVIEQCCLINIPLALK